MTTALGHSPSYASLKNISSAQANGAGGPPGFFNPAALAIHRGAIDQTTITTKYPPTVMDAVYKDLLVLGLKVQVESTFQYRCIRESSRKGASPADTPGHVNVVFGPPTEDPGDEVRLSVELTRLEGLSDTYSLDIRRLRGNLRSYKFLYETIRDKTVVSLT